MAPIRSRHRRGQPRGGGILVEFLVVYPILLIALLAIVEFGLLVANKQQLHFASRIGAQVAAEIPLSEGGPFPMEVIDAIEKQLADVGITPGKITLEHNVDSDPMMAPAPPFVFTYGALNCPALPLPNPPEPPPSPMPRYVRVTVCAESTELAPNLLNVFGFDLSTRVSQQTTTYPYEL